MTKLKILSAPERLEALYANMAKTALIAKRGANDCQLIAISKTHDADTIRPVITAGHRIFGENKIQEAIAKWPELRAETPEIQLHMVGQLQSNKAEDAVAFFDMIHTVDRYSLITALANAMDKRDRRPSCFIQVNIGNEDQKGGCAIADLPNLLAEARGANLPIIGLMCVPPATLEPAPYFALLAKIARDSGLEDLSMGMSGDYETAITLGATYIRVGSAIFGDRV